MRSDERLDGWKAIGAHFGRDRTTVIRWARDRGLPVRMVPGGQTRTVYALRSELDAWTARAEPSSVEVSAIPPVVAIEVEAPSPPAVAASGRTRRPAWAVLAAACAVAGVLGFVALRPPGGRSRPLPANPDVAALYVQARDDWGQRTAAGLARAIDGFTRVTRRDPRFAPAWASLADAYLLAREDGSLSDGETYPAAKRAAERAAALDPSLAAARRARGFIAYWSEHDRKTTHDAFAASLRLDPADAQTHLWWANILNDNGDGAAAMREYDAARLLDPGSIPIRTERAWALWTQGHEAQGAAELAAIVAQAPATEEAHDALSVVALARGEVAGFVREMRTRATLRAQPAFSAWVDELAHAEATGGEHAAMSAILHHALVYQSKQRFCTDAWPAYVASLAGDRRTLLDILRRGDAARETWGMVGYQRRIAERWAGDTAIAPLLTRRRPGPLES